MNNPLVSIITACKNSENTIKDTIDSVLHQTYKNIEYIIINGASTDRTLEIIKSYESKFKEANINYKYISEPDNGIYEAFNKGINNATGDWISFLGSDDVYVKNAVELYSEKMRLDLDLIYSNVRILGKKIMDSSWTWKKFKRNMIIPHAGAMHNRKYFEKYGVFDSTYEIAGDYELLLRSKQNLRTAKVDETLVIMSPGGISNNHIKKVYLETNRAKKETAKISSVICHLDYCKWMFKYYVKKMTNALVR